MPPLSREVKGRKGVGKFTGIIIAEVMDIETRQKGTLARFRIDRKTLEETPDDIVRIEVPIETTSCAPEDNGTTITLSHLAQSINFPTPESLQHVLAPDYAREERFSIRVNGNQIDHLQVAGHKTIQALSVPSVNGVQAEFIVSDKKLPKAMQGIVVKAKGKIVGGPRFFNAELGRQSAGRELSGSTAIVCKSDRYHRHRRQAHQGDAADSGKAAAFAC